MPSPIGHALGGVAAAWTAERIPAGELGEPAGPISTISTGLTLVCAVLGAAPDLDLLVPGLHRTVTHSVGAIIFTTIIAAGVTGWVTRKSGWKTSAVFRIAAICGAAYASHVFLDWLATDSNPPSGIQALWPFSHQWFIASWTIFPMTERTNPLSWRALVINARALGVEVLILGPVVLALGWARSRRT